jgi:xeroderma pigmentosum group C-complementing protein
MRPASTRPARGRIPQRRRRTEEEDNEIPEVYREMLAEAESRSPQSAESEKPTKRRKVGERTAAPVGVGARRQEIQTKQDSDDSRQLQTAYESDASEDLDIEWEDIDLQQTSFDSEEAPGTIYASKADDEPLQITFGLGNKEKKKVAPRQKPLSAAEKKLRLDTHKAHLLCLLRHVHRRNIWCNDPELQVRINLPRLLPRRV